MNYKFINVLAFAAGAAIGSAVTWKVVKTRYERIVREEIESVKQAFSDRLDDIQDTENTESECDGQINWGELEDLDEDDDEDDCLNDYEKVVKKYTNEEGGDRSMTDKPCVIDPCEFGDIDGYSIFELTYYADGVLEDEDYNIVDNVDELIGEGSLQTFGRYENDSVHVRNDHLRAYFEILKDPYTYEEARGTSPDKVES